MSDRKFKVCLSLDRQAYLQFKDKYGYPVSTFISRVLSACVADSTLCLRFMLDTAPSSFVVDPEVKNV